MSSLLQQSYAGAFVPVNHVLSKENDRMNRFLLGEYLPGVTGKFAHRDELSDFI